MIATEFKLNPVPGLSFNDEDEKHLHLLNDRQIPGCSTISGLFSEDSWKFAWPVKLMEEVILKETLDEYGDGTHRFFVRMEAANQEEYKLSWGIRNLKELLKKAKNAWRQKRDKSADTGKIAHGFIEGYIKDGTRLFFADSPEVQNCFDEFIKWEKIFKPKWLASEIQVGSVKHEFAGILDALAEINGKIVLIDFKTSNGIKSEYSIQLAGLCICLEEMGLSVDSRAILHLPKDGEYEYKEITTNLAFEKECFLAAKIFYGFKNKFMGGKNEFRKSKS